VNDASATSPTIDAADPTAAYANEPPCNGARLNQGATGNTPVASKSFTGCTPQPRLVMHGLTSPTPPGAEISLTLEARDATGAPLTGYSGTIRFSSSDGQAELPADYAFVSADQGTRTFAVTLRTKGVQSVTAVDLGDASMTATQSASVQQALGGSCEENDACGSSYCLGGVCCLPACGASCYGCDPADALPPHILTSPAGQATCGEPYRYSSSGTPIASGAVPMSWSLQETGTEPLPPGMTIHATTGEVSWVPARPTFGVHRALLIVQSAYGVDSQVVEIDVGCPEPQVTVGCGCSAVSTSALLGALMVMAVIRLFPARPKRRGAMLTGHAHPPRG
jgi:hypothetical protein